MPVQGGLFDGGWESGLDELVVDIVGAVADTALDTWRANLEHNIRVNQGHYLGETRVTRVSDTVAQTGDGVSKYGPWLEGQGTRNFPVTRFEGYNSARDAAEKVNATAGDVAAPVVVKFVEGMNA
jgi:hypothetical protein